MLGPVSSSATRWHVPSTASPSSLTTRIKVPTLTNLSVIVNLPGCRRRRCRYRQGRRTSRMPRPPRGTHSTCSTLAAAPASGGTSSYVGRQGAVSLQRGAAVAHRYDPDLSSSGTGRDKPPSVRPLQIIVAATTAIGSTSSTSIPSRVV